MDLSCNYVSPSHEANPSLATESLGSNKGVSPQLHTSNIATISPSVGGVGHNVALAAQRAGGGNVSVRLCSVVADDL
jgi:pseudouridine-5'-phosphate glycosidase/pseudouridine kinase